MTATAVAVHHRNFVAPLSEFDMGRKMFKTGEHKYVFEAAVADKLLATLAGRWPKHPLTVALAALWVSIVASLGNLAGLAYSKPDGTMNNWHFIAQSADYFAVDVESSPVAHYWSLSVEEQFYVVWPVLLAGIYALARRRRIDRRRDARLDVDASNVVAGERRVPDVSPGGGRDAVGSVAARRAPRLHVAGRRVEAPVPAGLPGEPDPPLEIERRRVEIRARGVGRERPCLHRTRIRIDAHGNSTLRADGVAQPREINQIFRIMHGR